MPVKKDIYVYVCVFGRTGTPRTSVHSIRPAIQWWFLDLESGPERTFLQMCVCEQPLSIPKHRVIYILDGYDDVEVHHDFYCMIPFQAFKVRQPDILILFALQSSGYSHTNARQHHETTRGGASFLQRWGFTILGGSVFFWCSGDGACEVLAKQSAGSGEEMVVRSSPGSSGWVLKDS